MKLSTVSPEGRPSAIALRSRPFACAPEVLLLAITAVGVGCGPAGPTVVKPPPPTVTKAKTQLGAPPTPARWSLNAAHAKGLRAKLDLGTTGLLYGGAGGVRWLDSKQASPVAAESTLPESITGMIAVGGGFAFVGESGTVYTTATALGPVTAKRSPPQPLRGGAAGKSSFLALAGDDILRSTDAGATWSKVTLPAGGGTPTHLALNESGVGLALLAPQRVLVTQDDGATWAALASPGVGAKRLVVDGNGDIMIEGLEASSILKLSPPRLEKVARAPHDGFDLPAPEAGPRPGYARAIVSGSAALIGLRYVEAIPEPEDPTRWRIAIGNLGEASADKSKLNGLTIRKVSELNGCKHVWVGGDPDTIVLACDDQGKSTPTVGGGFGTGPKNWGPPAPESRAVLRIFRSVDGGTTFKDDGTTGSQGSAEGHVWLGPDGSVFIEGACKSKPKGNSSSYCPPGPPLVRPVGGKFAKIDVPGKIRDIGNLAFAPTSGKAYTVGKIGQAWVLLVSANNARDFTRVSLPSVPALDPKGVSIGPNNAVLEGPATDESGVVTFTGHVGREFVVWVSEDEGVTVKVRRVPFKADAISMVGKRGLAYDRAGKAWETVDGATTWRAVGAPSLDSATISLVCGTHACLIGDRAIRIGWGGGGDSSIVGEAKPKTFAALPTLKCTGDGDWKPLGNLTSVPSVYDADLAGARFLALRHDRLKGSVSVLLGKSAAKGGLDVKEVSLFGPAGANTATAALPQIEGAAAIRFTFKREPPPKPPESKDKDKDKDKKPAAPPPVGPIVDGQKVDVDVAWYVASTGKVHKATIKGVGPLDPRDVSASAKDAAIANVALLSVTAQEKQSGLHVRPFSTRSDVPLFYVSEGGKVDKLPWPELPQKDIAGGTLALRTDAVRVGNRSVLLGFQHGPGLQMWASWANEAGTSWDARTWGLWPSLPGDVAWDFTYVSGVPSLVVQWPGGAGIAPTGWASSLKAPDADPAVTVALPTQPAASAACEAAATGSRVVAPFVGGTRHPVIVAGESDAIVMATGSALLKGTGKTGCVVAWDARPIARPNEPPTSTPYSALVSGSTKDGVLFRTNNLLGEVSVRALTCAATTEVPPGLENIDGFQRD